jgi:NAD(P)H-dependent FMN reductase
VKVLGLAGSPRRRGNTETLLEWVLEAAEQAGAQVTKVRLRELDIRGCTACEGCFDDGACVQRDDMQQLYPQLKEADSLVLAAPIFSMGMAAQAKAMVDRCQPFWAIKYVLGQKVVPAGRPERRGAYLSCAGTGLKDVFAGATQVARYFFHVLEAVPAGDILCPQVDARGDILAYPGGKEAAAELGRRLAEER